MTIYYSATTNAFYDSQVYNVNNIPEDKVAVAESTYKNLMAQQCAGRVIVAAADGTPTTIAQTCGSCTSTKYATKTELTNGLAAKANDSNVVHKTGDETINGVKSFGSMIKATNGTVQVGADTGYSVTFNYNGNITCKQARGTYNIFFPEGSGTLALTSDIAGKANDNNVVHKTGDETITGNKTFNNNVTVCGNFYDKNVQADLTQTPASNLYTQYRFTDKNNATMGYIQHVQRNTGVNQLTFIARDSNNTDYGFLVNTNKELLPVGNNTYSLGASSAKWAKIYSDDIVHTSGNEYIGGNKIFSNTIHRYADLTTSGYAQVYRFDDTNANACGHIYNSTHWSGDTIFNRHGVYNNKSGKTMEIDIIATDSGVGMAYVTGTANKGNLETVTSATDHTGIATMGWVNNPATSINVVHRSGDETISGAKIFLNDIFRKNTSVDLTTTPTGYTNTNIIFADKNDKTIAHFAYVQRPSGVNDVGIFAWDKNGTAHGIHINTNNEVIPLMSSSESYSLGSTNNKWANVYASEINTKYFTHTHDSRTSYSYLPKTSGTLAIQERTRASAAVENRTLLFECAGGLDAGDITLNDMYSKFNALLIVYSNDDGGGISTYYLDCAELDIRREVAGGGGSATFLLVDGHSWWACTGASTGTKFVHSKNNGLRIHKIYGLAKYY